jgi:hypothetical protein
MDASRVRVVQIGAGTIGATIARLVMRRADLELVGVIDSDPSKVGRTLLDVLGAETTPLVVEGDLSAIHRLAPQIVTHSTLSDLALIAPQLEAIVSAGCSVISTCEELSFTESLDARRIDQAARASGVAVLGTGINPGFVMDRLPATLSSVCEEVEAVHITRVVDTSQRRRQLQIKTGLGLDLATFDAKRAAGVIRHVGLPESARLVATYLGWKPDSLVETIEPVVADRDLHTDSGVVRSGAVAGVHQTVACFVDGFERIRLNLWMAYGVRRPRDEIHLYGSPPVHMEIRGGIFGDSATAGVVVNSIHSVLGLTPGLASVLDIALTRAMAGRRPGVERK